MPKTKTVASQHPPLPVQILAIVGFTGFAIPVALTAMDRFGVLGLVLAAFLAYVWTRLAGLGGAQTIEAVVERLRPQTPDAQAGSGSASFDAYRAELLARLEKEQANFEGFLGRLREARDRSEFDTFMSDREERQRSARDTSPA